VLIARPKASRQRIVTNCLLGDAVGDPVRVTGPEIGGLWQVTKVAITAYSQIPAIGIIVAKINPTTAIVQVQGEVKGVYTGLTPGRVYYLDIASAPTLTPPTPTIGNPRVYIHQIGIAVDTDAMLLKIDPHLSVRVL